MTAMDLFVVDLNKPDGSVADYLVARGTDGSLWMEARYLDLNHTDLKILWRDKPGCLLKEPNTGRMLVEMSTFIARSPSPEIEKELTLYFDNLLDALHPTNFRNEVPEKLKTES